MKDREKFRDDISKVLGKHKMTVREMICEFGSLLAFSCAKSDDPLRAMTDLIGVLKNEFSRFALEDEK